jgi:hypothetical protein
MPQYLVHLIGKKKIVMIPASAGGNPENQILALTFFSLQHLF